MVATYIPATGCAWGRAKSTPICLKGRRESAVRGGGDFADGSGDALNVVAAREVLFQDGTCEGMHGRMRAHAVQRWIKASAGERAEGLQLGGF